MNPDNLLRSGADELGIELSGETVQRFALFRETLLKWNRSYNLTAIRDREGVVVKHFLDSMLFLSTLPPDPGLTVVDLGSGGGFPGIPIKLVRPGIHCCLVEPSRKKATFLRHLARTLDLTGLDVYEARTQEVPDLLQQADAVVTRALYKVAELQEELAGLTRPGTVVIMNKGPTAEDEIRQAPSPVELRKIQLPIHNVDRWLIIWITP